ncbi:MAG TPA: serine/threonine-protein kinase [Nannocystaceae bacterium]|nr:serine/threonine-protein kinase [Nannocystaceae bacterium]
MDELDGLLVAPAEAAPGLDTQLMRGSLQARLFDRDAAPLRVGRFEIIARIGQGGMGSVYAAHDPQLDRKVAVKLLRRDAVAHDRTATLLREARSLAQLTHPNVVTVFDSGIVDDEVFVAMELLDGGSLATWTSAHPPQTRADVARTLELFVAAGRGLAAAHAAGLVHRDFKPANVLLGQDGRLKVGDFGLARPEANASTLPDDATEHTAGSGGTPAYMAPEQFAGLADAKSDQFAFCVALWEALWGERPFTGLSVAHAITEQPPKIHRRGIPVARRVHVALLRGLAFDPGARWPDMAALLDEIDPARRLARSRRRWALGLGAIAIVAALRPWQRDAPPCARDADMLAGAWDEQARQRTAAAFASVAAPIAADTWARLEPELDAYTQEWWRVRDEACAASLVRHERSEDDYALTMSCLDRRRDALAAVVIALVDLDAETAANALLAARRLPAISPCAEADPDRELLPQDAGLRAEIEDVRRGLARVDAELALGHLQVARESLSPLLARADALERAPLQAEARWLEGELALQGIDYPAARTAYETALGHAARAGDDRRAALIWPKLIDVVGGGMLEPTHALAWELPAVVAQRRAGGDPLLRAQIHDSVGTALARIPDPARAEAEHRASLALLRANLPADDHRIAAALGGLARAASALGRLDEALALQREAFALYERVLGNHHPKAANMQYNVAVTLTQLGRTEEAVTELRAALRLHEEIHGPDHVQVAITLAAMGPALAKNDALDEGLAACERAGQICDRHPDTPGSDCAFVYSNLGTLRDWSDKLPESLEAQQKAIALMERASSPEIGVLAIAITNAATLRARLGDRESARAQLRHAIELYERALGPDAAALWHPLFRLARIEYEQGRVAEALPLIARASKILRVHPFSPARMGNLEHEHAMIRWDAGLRDRETIAIAERGRELAQQGDDAEEVAAIDDWLARHRLPRSTRR